jgi:hypothetical protein
MGVICVHFAIAGCNAPLSPAAAQKLETNFFAKDPVAEAPPGWELHHNKVGGYRVGLPEDSDVSEKSVIMKKDGIFLLIRVDNRDMTMSIPALLDDTQKDLKGRRDHLIAARDIPMADGISCRAVALDYRDSIHLCRIYVTEKKMYLVSASCNKDLSNCDERIRYYFGSFAPEEDQ